MIYNTAKINLSERRTKCRILHKSESILPAGTPFVEIGNPECLEIYIEVLSTNAVKVDVGENALLVPISSLFRQTELWSVFKVLEGAAAIHSIEVDRSTDLL